MTSSEIDRLAQAAAAAVDQDLVIRWTQELVRIRSVVDEETGTTEADAAAWVAARLREAGLDPLTEEVAPGRPNVICDWSGQGFDPERHRTLMFEGHTDVVTAGDRADWSFDPFGGERRDGAILGRGSADMKAGVVAAMVATLAVRQAAPQLTGRIRLGIVVDEEGMMLGIKDFIARGHAQAVSGAIICEPEENELCLVQKGAIRVHVRALGAMAHGAMPYAGVNPVAGLARLLVALEGLQEREQERLGEHPHLGLPWITPTVARAPDSGEAQLNVMPGRAYQALDIRTVPGQDHQELMAQVRAEADRVAAATDGLRFELNAFESRPWTETPADDPLVAALEAAYPDTIGGPPRFGGVPGATDGTFLRASAGVPIVTVGPGDRTVPHQADEFVREAEVIAAARLYAAAAVRYLGEATSSR